MNILKFVPKSIDAVRLVFDVDKVYRKRNNLVVLVLIYWCIWIKDGLASADRQENLDVIVMIFHESNLYLCIRLHGIFLVLIVPLQVLC